MKDKLQFESQPRRIRLLSLILALGSVLGPAFAQTVAFDHAKSRIDVEVTATGDSFVGHLQKYKADVTLEDETAIPKTAVVTWNFADLKTGKDKRDQAMLEWLEQDKWPQGSFELRQWKTRGDTTWAVGQLAFHGVTNSITMPVTVARDGENVRIQGEAEMDYRQNELKIIRMMLFFTVDPKVKVAFDLKGRVDGPKS